jgi:dUTP pyrophosphatase
MIGVQWKILDDRAMPPRNAYGDDAGWDLFAIEDTPIYPNTPTDVRTGIAIALPEGYFGRIVHRSSAPRKKGVMVLEGIIDAGFRGELFACAFAWTWGSFQLEAGGDGPHGVGNITAREVNHQPRMVQAGESIAQLIIQEVRPVEFLRVDALPESLRGEKGFGSSGA